MRRRVGSTPAEASNIVSDAIAEIQEKSRIPSGGKWLENLTIRVAPHIKDWDISACWTWKDWPDRKKLAPDAGEGDIGIDLVAYRGSDDELIAIQCKSRKLDESGKGKQIGYKDISTFITASKSEMWAERWLITNGNIPMAGGARRALSMDKDNPIHEVNISADLLLQNGEDIIGEECEHCKLGTEAGEARRTKSCMQREVVKQSVKILRQHKESVSGGIPRGQARGRIILPCGTGKTRISLRIIEELTRPGELSIVLCPSIALVAQIRREYLQHSRHPIRALAVCSDKTAGYDPRREGSRNSTDDPTIDNSCVSESEVKGKVTTDLHEIAHWIDEGYGKDRVSVIFGTYQSGHQIAEALRKTDSVASVLVADEAHRTAGIRRKKRRGGPNQSDIDRERKIRDFTLCHNQAAFPATYRVYQTATPKIYDLPKATKVENDDWIVRNMDDESVFGVVLYRMSYVDAVRNGWLADYRIIALGVNSQDSLETANTLARKTMSRGRSKLTTQDYIHGMALALAMAGGTKNREQESANAEIRSCIAFMNTVDKSKNMAKDLGSETVRKWLESYLMEDTNGSTYPPPPPPHFFV